MMAKTGLGPIGQTGNTNPGYDYWIIFSKSHVFTKRSHASARFNNPTVLEHKDFGVANWHISHVSAEPLRSADGIRRALESWQELTATTTFTSIDGKRQFRVDYPVKWADYMTKSDGFRVETGPVVLLDPDQLRVGQVPEFADFQWTHLDYREFDRVRCLQERPTSILDGATFTPPAEHNRQLRKHRALSKAELDELLEILFSGRHLSLPADELQSLFSTDHYAQVEEVDATTEIYAIAD